MLNGPLTRKIIQFALPIVLTSIVQQLFNSSDTAIIGRFGENGAPAAVGQITAPPLLRLINTPDEILGDAATYLRVYCLSVPFLMLHDFGAAIFRSRGDSKRPLIALMISGGGEHNAERVICRGLRNERHGSSPRCRYRDPLAHQGKKRGQTHAPGIRPQLIRSHNTDGSTPRRSRARCSATRRRRYSRPSRGKLRCPAKGLC